jgi:hypothetical protein
MCPKANLEVTSSVLPQTPADLGKLRRTTSTRLRKDEGMGSSDLGWEGVDLSHGGADLLTNLGQDDNGGEEAELKVSNNDEDGDEPEAKRHTATTTRSYNY